MNSHRTKRTMTVALIGASCALFASAAWAGIDDYEFRLVQPEIKAGDAAVVAARLIDKRTGKPVPDAVIFAQRLDMAPDGMAAMTVPIVAAPSSEPGVYSFKARLPMPGGWRLSLGAKVQGEIGTLDNKLEFKVVP